MLKKELEALLKEKREEIDKLEARLYLAESDLRDCQNASGTSFVRCKFCNHLRETRLICASCGQDDSVMEEY